MGQRSGMSGLVGGLVAVASALLLVTACDDDDSGSGGDTTQACDRSLDVAGIDASFSGTPCAGSFTVANCPSGGPSPNDADLSCRKATVADLAVGT